MTSTHPSNRLFWSLAFLYAALMALMFQKVALPLLPGVYAGHGLLINDPITIHNAAVTYADKIRQLGWNHWKLFPSRLESGNVGILSALYALFGPEPALFIPFTAAAEATGALLIYRLGPTLFPGRTGALGGLVAALAFLAFPSSLQWYGQNLKDTFVIAGMLAMLYAQLRILQSHDEARASRLPQGLLLMVGGAALCAVFRPYFPILMLALFSLCWLCVTATLVLTRSLIKERRVLAQGVLMLAVLAPVALYAARSHVAEIALTENGATTSSLDADDAALRALAPTSAQAMALAWKWQQSAWIPQELDHLFRRVSELRRHFAIFGFSVAATSSVDLDRLPHDVPELLGYLPRALQIGLFAPFPQAWHERVSAPRLIAAVETAVWYLFFPGVLLLAWRRPSRALLFGACFAAMLLIIVSYINPNIGTIYRQRFGAWMFILLIGAVGWASLLLPTLRRMSALRAPTPEQSPSPDGQPDPGLPPSAGIASIMAGGSMVLIVTLVCFLGFTARDLLLIREFGATSLMDGYFFAAMLPTFFISCLCMPMADSLMRAFVETKTSEGLKPAERMVRAIMWHGFLGMAGVAVLLFVGARPLLAFVMSGRSPSTVDSAATMFRCFLPLLVISVWTVVGNAVLSALHRLRTVALTQLVVPALAVAAIVVFPSRDGPYPAIAGMVLGALLHALLIVWRLQQLGFVLLPEPAALARLPASVMRSYKRLALAAVVGATVTPVGYVIAGLVPGDGGVSAWALASKLTTLFSSLASAAVAYVVLPHFSRLIRHHATLLRADMRLLLVIGNTAGGIGAVILGLFAVPVSAALFSHGASADGHIRIFSDILRIGALQLPVAITYTVMTKISGVVGTSSRALAGSAIALSVNALLGYLLVKQHGILGLAAASLCATVLSTLFLATVTRKASGLRLGDVAALLASWASWALIMVAAGWT